MMLLIACGGEKVDDETAQDYITKAESVINLLNNKQYDELIALFDDNMKAGLTENELVKLEPFIEEGGEFEKIDKSSVEKDNGIYVAVLTANYSNATRIYTISFNENDEVSGLFVK